MITTMAWTAQGEWRLMMHHACLVIIINRMFILSNIKISSPETLFSPDCRKFLKFQINKSTKKHPFPSKFLSQHEIQWDADMTFPETLYDRAVAFEVHIRHEFGYNEEELSSTLQGEIKIDREMSFSTFQVRRAADSKCVGYLSCRVRHKGETVEEIIETKIAKKQILIIKSIIAHVPAVVNKKINFRLAVGKQEAKTSYIRTLSGDLVFPDRMTLDKTDLDRLGTLSIYELKNDCQIKLGEGKISLIGAKPEKKVTLMNLREELLGQAYIDCAQQNRDDENRLKSNSLPNYLHKIKLASDAMMKNTSTSGRTTNFKKISVVSPNQSIVFSTSQRFKQTNNPQFLGTHSSGKSKLSFGQFRFNRLSKLNQKLLFSIDQQTPGVGRYNLPTIWDRY